MVMVWDINQLGYYRFKQGSLGEAFRSSMGSFVMLKSTSLPLASYENVPNDICYPFINTASLPKLTFQNTVNYVLDSRFRRSQQNYAYTFSLWYKLDSVQFYDPSPFTGNTKSIFGLDGVLQLWFPDQNHFQVYFQSRD